MGAVVIGLMFLVFTAVGAPLLVVPVLALTAGVVWVLKAAFHDSLVEATPGHLIVRNPVHTHEVAWADVRGFRGGSFLVVELRSGDLVRAWGVQGRNWDLIKDRSTYADEVADQLGKHLSDSTS